METCRIQYAPFINPTYALQEKVAQKLRFSNFFFFFGVEQIIVSWRQLHVSFLCIYII